MKFALIGFGQTGHLIKQMAEDRGHEIAAVFNRQHSLQSMFEHDGNPDCDRNQILASIDAFIDFSIPTAVATNVECVSQLKKPIVIGTSGWYERLPQIEQLVNESGIGCIYAHNFSLGMNLFFRLVEEATRRISRFNQYDLSVQETHHRHKVDSPSGRKTAAKIKLSQARFRGVSLKKIYILLHYEQVQCLVFIQLASRVTSIRLH